MNGEDVMDGVGFVLVTLVAIMYAAAVVPVYVSARVLERRQNPAAIVAVTLLGCAFFVGLLIAGVYYLVPAVWEHGGRFSKYAIPAFMLIVSGLVKLVERSGRRSAELGANSDSE